VIQIKNEQGFVMVFVLLILLLSGVVSASLLHNSMIGNKIINNYIEETKTDLTGRAGILVLSEMIKKNLSVNKLLVFSYGEEYNILINKVNKEKESEIREQKYEVIGNYNDNDKILYYTPRQE
jgi:hypothetical protein